MGIHKYESELVVNIPEKSKRVIHGVFNKYLEGNKFVGESCFKKVLKLSTFSYFSSGAYLSDFMNNFRRSIENQKTNNILDETRNFNTTFIF